MNPSKLQSLSILSLYICTSETTLTSILSTSFSQTIWQLIKLHLFGTSVKSFLATELIECTIQPVLEIATGPPVRGR